MLDDGTDLKVVTGVDDHSRFCVSAGLMTRAVARAVCGHFVAALERHGGNVSATARAIGLHRQSLQKILRRLDIEP